MKNKHLPLLNHSFINDYLIQDVLLDSKDSIIYLVENMKLGKKFTLTEFFPDECCMRSENKESITIFNKNNFEDIKKEFLKCISCFSAFEDMNIMKIIDTFEANDTVYIVNSYDGEIPFTQFFKAKTLNALDVIILFNPIFSFLTRLHNQGDIYRHIHRKNIFIDKKGRLLLTQAANAYPATYKHYTPIEQYIDENKATKESDIYALSALMYEVVTGLPPIDAREREEALQSGKDDPLVLLEVKDGHLNVFYEFINKALSMSQKDRPSSLSVLQTILKKKESTEKKDPLEILEGKNPKRTSLLHLIGIILIASVSYALIVDHSDIKITQNDVSKLDVLRYRWAAYWGDVKAQNALGALYAQGLYVEHNPKQSIEWYQKAADQGNINAMLSLSQIYDKGKGVHKDRQKTLDYLDQAGEEEKIPSQRSMAYNYYIGKDVKKDEDKAFELGNKAAKRGDVYSMGLLGWFYERGIGTKKNESLSAQWYQKAAKKGSEYAAYRLGRMYEYEKGFKKDVKQAMYWYKVSADKGYNNAMTRLGKKYFYGFKDSKTHIKRDLKKARHWFTKASALKNTVANKFLAKIDKEEDPREIRRKRDDRIKKEILKVTKEFKYSTPKKRVSQLKKYEKYIDYGEYIKDIRSGLLWQKDGRHSGKLNFYQAKEYAEKLTLGGIKGWRVPKKYELKMIFPALKIPFENTPKPSEREDYWTSERDYTFDDYAWLYHWYDNGYNPKGGANNCYASKNYGYVRAVHNPID